MGMANAVRCSAAHSSCRRSAQGIPNVNNMPCAVAALLVVVSASSFAAENKAAVVPAVDPAGDQRSRQDAPGEAIPGNTVRPEGMDQSNVPKTAMDRKNAQAQDVGASNIDMNKPQLAELDRNFLINSNQGDMVEVSAGEMAKRRARARRSRRTAG